MNNLILKTKLRKKGEKKEKSIPAVIYGPEIESTLLWVEVNNFRKIYQESGESSLVEVEIEGDKKDHLSLIYDVQLDPVQGTYRHVDFFQVKKGKKIEAEIAIDYIGESPAVKEQGGIFLKNIDDLKIRCLPKDLPRKIEVDISNLENLEDCIYIKDIKLPEGVTIDLEDETVIAKVAAPRSEEELKELDEKVEADIDQVETVGDKEEKEEGESEQKEEASDDNQQKEEK